MRISDWSSDVCSSDLATLHLQLSIGAQRQRGLCRAFACFRVIDRPAFPFLRAALETLQHDQPLQSPVAQCAVGILHVALVGVCTQGGGVDDPAAKDGSATIDLDLPTLAAGCPDAGDAPTPLQCRSEEHTSELQSLMRISYAVFCLK